MVKVWQPPLAATVVLDPALLSEQQAKKSGLSWSGIISVDFLLCASYHRPSTHPIHH